MPDNVLSKGSFSNPKSSTASSLLLRLKAQQPQAWDRLAQLYGPLVYQWCLQAGLQRADADDVLQEVFRTVSVKINSYRHDRDGDTFRGWLWTITRNKIGDWLRRIRRQPQAAGGSTAQGDLMRVAEDEQSASSLGFGSLFQDVFQSVRPEFQDRTWQAFWQVVVEGQTPAIVAERLEITVNAVYLAKSHVLRRIRQELGDVEE